MNLLHIKEKVKKFKFGEKELFAPLNKLMLTLILITILIVATVIVFVAKQMILPLNKLSDFAEEIATGAISQAEGASKASIVTRELVEDINEISKKCNYMIDIVEKLTDRSTKVSQGVQQTVDSIKNIDTTNKHNVEEIENLLKQSKEIGQIVDVIGDIS